MGEVDLTSFLIALPDRGPTLVAIDGLAAAGKSSLIAGLSSDTIGRPLVVVSADEFYGPEERAWQTWTPREGYERYFDHVRLERELLLPLRAHLVGKYRRYDWERRREGEVMEVRPGGVVIVEGVYLLRRRLREYWDASIWVDTPRDIRERRLRERGENDAGWIHRWMLAEDYYDEVDRPRDAATYTVSGER